MAGASLAEGLVAEVVLVQGGGIEDLAFLDIAGMAGDDGDGADYWAVAGISDVDVVGPIEDEADLAGNVDLRMKETELDRWDEVEHGYVGRMSNSHPFQLWNPGIENSHYVAGKAISHNRLALD